METMYIVDAFADKPFSGNPAAVCLLSETKEKEWMQSVAAEMNQPETAFLLQQGQDYQLKWFSPLAEVDLCGHATLASAHILFEEGWKKSTEQIQFHTNSGLLRVTKKEPFLEMDFPTEPAVEADAPKELVEALGAMPLYVGKNRMDYLVEIASEDFLRKMKPNRFQLMKISTRGIIVTCQSQTSDFDFVSRFFAPSIGIDEDPVTGSAHCCLGAYWQAKLHKNDLKGYQASVRGGIVYVHVDNQRTFLKGKAVTVVKGHWLGYDFHKRGQQV